MAEFGITAYPPKRQLQNPFAELFGQQQQQMLPTPPSFAPPAASQQPTVTTGQQPPQADQNPFAMFMQWMMSQGQQQQQSPFDFAGLLRESRNDPQGDANKGYIPGVANQYNPFDNGFFNGQSQQVQPMTPATETGAGRLGKKPVRSPFASY